MIPQVSYDTLPSQTLFPMLGPTWDPSGNPTTPKRDPPSAPPAEPDPKVAKTAGAAGFGIYPTPRYRYSCLPVDHGRHGAIEPGRERTHTWMASVLGEAQAIYDPARPSVLTQTEVPPRLFAIRSSSQKTPATWMYSMVSLTTALKAAKADRVCPGEFRTLDENASLLCPLVVRGFQVWRLPERQARVGKECHEWRLGARPGPNASGAYPKRVFDLDATPPRTRKACCGK